MYTVFHRTWWTENKEYPNGLEPSIGKKRIIKKNVKTEEEARAICNEWNLTHKEGRYSDRAEFMKS